MILLRKRNVSLFYLLKMNFLRQFLYFKVKYFSTGDDFMKDTTVKK